MTDELMAPTTLLRLELAYLKALGCRVNQIAPGVLRISHSAAPHFEELQAWYVLTPRVDNRNILAAADNRKVPVILFPPARMPRPVPRVEPWQVVSRPILVGVPHPVRSGSIRIRRTTTEPDRQAYDTLAGLPYARWHPEWTAERSALAPFRTPGPGLNGYVAWLRGEPVGLADAFTLGRLVKIENLWVAPEHRGKGVGSTLLAHASSGRAVVAIVEPDTEALPFYTTRGLSPKWWQSFGVRLDP